MNKQPEDALDKAQRLSKEKQEMAAPLLEQLAQSEGEAYALSSDERIVVSEALARSQRGEFADCSDVDAFLLHPWA